MYCGGEYTDNAVPRRHIPSLEICYPLGGLSSKVPYDYADCSHNRYTVQQGTHDYADCSHNRYTVQQGTHDYADCSHNRYTVQQGTLRLC